MKSFRFLKQNLKESWPIVCLFVVTAVVVVWAGTMVREVLSPPTLPPLAQSQTVPKQTVSSDPTSLPSAAPGLANPSRLPTQDILPQASQRVSTPASSTLSSAKLQAAGQASGKPFEPSLTPSSTAPKISAVPTQSPNPLPQARYGHLPYADAAPERLVTIGTYGSGDYKRTEFLDQDAATAFEQMVAVAKTDGVGIIPISGFRTIAQQEKLFARQIQRQGSESAAARLSAPPGYSEHHTGYAVDVGDAAQPSADVQHDFENTAAYRWLTANAKRFGFELSYPRNNVQGVSFEPWHWRFIASEQASAVFAVAHTLSQQ